MAETPRKRRAAPKRTGPIRRSAAASASKPATTARRQEPDEGLDLAVSDAVAQAVRLGYKVLAENLEEGRIAAKQFRVGEYNVRNVPNDLNVLAKRMVNLARDLSTTTFDVLDRVLQDPTLMKAVRRMAESIDPVAPTAKPSAASPSQSAPPAPAKSGKMVAPANPSPVVQSVPLTCRFSGAAEARVLASWLTRPDSPTPLATAGLTTLEAGVPPIAGVTFHASNDGLGVVAEIQFPSDQAAGVYSGVVVGVADGKVVGALTIQVGA
ncbi:MAG TPA: hypothetical protein VGG68_10280 [Caulobacteraceae bacterium]|jgi:hypothetical protein